MDAAQTGENTDEGGGRLSQRRHGYHSFALRGIAAALLLVCCSFIRHTYVTWQEDPCTTATITLHGIRTPQELTLVCNGESHTAVGRELALPDRRRIYHFTLRGLDPDTQYTCQVEDSFFHFKTLGRKPPYRFVEGGDWENTEGAVKLAELAATTKPDAVLLGGDYPSNVLSKRDYMQWDHWLDVYTKHLGTTPFVMAIGNHEVVGGYNQPKAQAPFFFHYFRTEENPESYYTLPLGDDYQLYILDSGHISSHAAQAAWLEEKLQTDRVKIALYHVPLYPSVRFADKGLSYRFCLRGLQLAHKPTRIYSAQSAAGRLYWQPLFEKYGVLLAFEHHDQTLKRTQKLNGTTYLGDGGWGPIQQCHPVQGYFHRYFATLKGKEHFFWLLDIDKSIEVRALSKDNRELDRWKS